MISEDIQWIFMTDRRLRPLISWWRKLQRKHAQKKVAQLCSMYDTEEFDDVARLT